jgi:ATP-binding cassette subfamily B protein
MNYLQVEQQLQRSPLFSVVEADDIRVLVEAGELVSYRLGQTILPAGQAPGAFYILVSGRARFVAEQNGREYALALAQSGEHFGEEGVLSERPLTYQVRAADDVVALRIPLAAVRELLNRKPDLASYFQRWVDDISIRAFLKLFTLLTPLSARRLKNVLNEMTERTLAAGEFVFHEGEPGDAFYIIRSGRVEIVKETEGTVRRLMERGDGDFFGELALLYGGQRAAGVRCLEPTRLFRLDRRHFEALLAEEPEVKERLLEVISHYTLESSLRQKWGLNEAAPAPSVAVAAAEVPGVPTSANEGAPAPPSRLFGRWPYVRQHDESDCGAACMAMVLQYWGSRISVSRLREVCNVSRDGASLLSLAEGAERFGFNARGVKIGVGALGGVSLPAIAHWEGNHFVVLYEVRGEKVRVADPGVGMRHMSLAEFEKGWTGYLLQLVPTPQLGRTDPTEARVSTLGRYLPLLRPFRWILAEIFLASLLLNVLGLAAPMFTQTIVDNVLTHQNFRLLDMIAVGMLIVLVFETAINAARRFLVVNTSNRLDVTLLVMFYRHMLGLPLEYFEKRKIGDFISRFTETQKLRQMLTGTAITTILDTMMVVVYVGLMLTYNIKLTLALLAVMPLFALLTLLVTPPLKRINRESFNARTSAESFLIESLNGIQTVKSLAVEQGIRWKWEGLYVAAINTDMRGQRLRIVIEAIGTLLNRTSSILLLYLGASLVMRGELSVGQLMAFSALIGSVTGPMARLINLWDDLNETLIAVERLNDVFDAELENSRGGPAEARVRPGRLEGHVRFENVSFRYGTRDESNVLSNITLDIAPGQTIALVGRSGSGKTTLAKLLLGLYQPTSGKIFVDGHDLSRLDVAAYRRQVGVVMQDSFLLSGTLRDNIAPGEQSPDQQRLVSAAVLANANDFISAMPLGYDTMVGERGLALSGGQRQRVAIARALYGDPRMLILDEATSNLDVESERAIQGNLERVLSDRTAVIIAHRLSTVQNADRIIVLDQGMIVEQGTHRELMDARGLYYFLNNQQLKL